MVVEVAAEALVDPIRPHLMMTHNPLLMLFQSSRDYLMTASECNHCLTLLYSNSSMEHCHNLLA